MSRPGYIRMPAGWHAGIPDLNDQEPVNAADRHLHGRCGTGLAPIAQAGFRGVVQQIKEDHAQIVRRDGAIFGKLCVYIYLNAQCAGFQDGVV